MSVRSTKRLICTILRTDLVNPPAIKGFDARKTGFTPARRFAVGESVTITTRVQCFTPINAMEKFVIMKYLLEHPICYYYLKYKINKNKEQLCFSPKGTKIKIISSWFNCVCFVTWESVDRQFVLNSFL